MVVLLLLLFVSAAAGVVVCFMNFCFFLILWVGVSVVSWLLMLIYIFIKPLVPPIRKSPPPPLPLPKIVPMHLYKDCIIHEHRKYQIVRKGCDVDRHIYIGNLYRQCKNTNTVLNFKNVLSATLNTQ